MKRTRPQRAQLALLLEVAATPTPGNVDREREYADLRFEHFLAGAIGAHGGLSLAANAGSDAPGIGRAFERAVAGMANQEGGNTQFGALLLVSPLVRAGAEGDLSPEGASAVVESTGVEDAVAFYRAFDHVDVAVGDPPDGLDALDVRRGSEAIPAVRDRQVTLEAVMAEASAHDGIAREWTRGFERTFTAAASIEAGTGPVPARAAETFLDLLAVEPDPFVAIQHDEDVAADVRDRAAAARDGAIDPAVLGEQLVREDINPGTTADILAGGLFVALERGVSV